MCERGQTLLHLFWGLKQPESLYNGSNVVNKPNTAKDSSHAPVTFSTSSETDQSPTTRDISPTETSASSTLSHSSTLNFGIDKLLQPSAPKSNTTPSPPFGQPKRVRINETLPDEIVKFLRQYDSEPNKFLKNKAEIDRVCALFGGRVTKLKAYQYVRNRKYNILNGRCNPNNIPSHSVKRNT